MPPSYLGEALLLLADELGEGASVSYLGEALLLLADELGEGASVSVILPR